jgi:predicted flap endonuclease-1-like 5' DNA nuclease
MAEVAKKETQKVFYVVNTVRRVGTRMHRALSARRHRWQLWIAGQRLLRNKKLPLSEEKFRAEESKIHEMLMAGQIAVITPDNIKVTTTPTGQYVLTKLETGATKLLAKGEKPSCFGGAVAEVKKAEPKVAPVVEAPVEPEPEVESKPDDLTELPNIGGGRARKLEASGVTSYAQVVEMGAASLMELLNVTEEVAEEIVAAAADLS